MVKVKKNLNAVSIIETLVALAILTISFGVGMLVYLNVITNDSIILKTRAGILAEDIANQAIKNQRFLNETFEIQNLVVKKIIRPFNESNDLLRLQVTVYKDQQLIETYNQLIPNKEK